MAFFACLTLILQCNPFYINRLSDGLKIELWQARAGPEIGRAEGEPPVDVRDLGIRSPVTTESCDFEPIGGKKMKPARR